MSSLPSPPATTASFEAFFSSRVARPTTHLMVAGLPFTFQPVRSLPLKSTIGLPGSAFFSSAAARVSVAIALTVNTTSTINAARDMVDSFVGWEQNSYARQADRDCTCWEIGLEHSTD